MNFEDFKYHEKNIPASSGQKTLYFENLKNTFYEEIKAAKNKHDYFNQFDQDSVENFMIRYASHKANLAEYYTYYINESYHNKELKYREKTEKVFNLILQKKLWNIQLQWRANLINIKEIRTTWDFSFWNRHITSCPFLPLVEEAEVAILKQYLRDPSNNHDSDEWIYNWQDYREIMEKDEDGDLSAMPDWYEFYDNRMGTGTLLLLPDERGSKEDYYADLGREFYINETKEKIATPATPYVPPPPYLFSGIEEMFKYARKFEDDKHIVELFKIANGLNKTEESYGNICDDEIDAAIELLKEADYAVPINGNSDWREAIKQCAQQYINNVIADEIDVVYEEYRMLAEIGLSKNDDQDVMSEFEKDSIAKIITSYILKGREICGEPQDFDF
ncbi:MAG: hypothetical protein HXX18_02855 [Bacteroidetes bacterium]|nr:hypothetical protein [Bacteroidota bacterium]